MAGKFDLNPIITSLISGIAGLIAGISGFKVAQRNARATERGQDRQSETTITVAQIDDRKDVTHVLQQSLLAAQQESAALRAEVAAFRVELDKAKSDFLDYKERLGTANVEIREQRGKLETQSAQIAAQSAQIAEQQTQIVELRAENTRRNQESEETISRLNDENVNLVRDVAALQGENKELRASLSHLRRQVQGNTQEIRTIGLPEIKAAEAVSLHTTRADMNPER